tara:strand:- start:136 stop:543 length:408 start_codon:yes stop_codon:yes gene_type:complete
VIFDLEVVGHLCAWRCKVMTHSTGAGRAATVDSHQGKSKAASAGPQPDVVMIRIGIAAKGITKETDSTGDVAIEGMKISNWVTKRAWLGRDLQLGVAGNFQRQHHLIPKLSASNQISISNTGRRFACDHKNAVLK